MINIDIAVVALGRYLLTLLAANLFLILFLFIYISYKKMNICFSIIILTILYVTTPASWQLPRLIKKDYTNESIQYRDQYNAIYNHLKSINPQKDIVYYIKEAEVDIYLSNFSVFPITLSDMPRWNEDLNIERYSSILFDKNNSTLFKINTNMEKERLAERADGNIYIYIYKVTDANRSLYNKIFEYNSLPMLDETLYLVKDVNNIATLSIVN